MSEPIHIFKKDVKRLRYHVSLTLLAAAAFGCTTTASASGPGPTVVVLAVSWFFLIAAVIHLEPLPGTGHFWLTRPYRRSSLFAAKALFIVAFVNVPLAVSDLIVLYATGFPVIGNIGGLIWTQILLACAFEVPVAAIASVTSGLLDFLIATLFLVLITLASYLVTTTLHISLGWGHFEWVREYIALSLLSILSAGILFSQYAHRATLLSRIAALAGPVLLFSCAAAFPWTAAFALQSWLHGNRIQVSAISVNLDSERQWAGRLYRGDQEGLMVDIPVTIAGIPNGTELKVHGARMTIYAPNGRTLPIEEPPFDSFETDPGMLSLRILIPEHWYQEYRDETLQVKGLLYFALCNKARYSTVDPSGSRVRIPNIGLCRVNSKSLVCDSAFHPSNSYVQAQLTESSNRGVIHSDAFWAGSGDASPFPAWFNINPVFQWSSPTLSPITEVVLKRNEPIAYAVRDFELDHLILANFKMHN